MAFNGMLIDNSLWQSVNTLSCYIPSLFRHAILSQPNHTTIFCAVSISYRRKRKRSSCPFERKRSVKRWQGNCFDKNWVILTNIVKDTQQQLNPAAVVANLVALFVSTDHMDQTAICIVSHPVYYHNSYSTAPILETMTSLGFSLESVVLASFPTLACAFGVVSYSSSYLSCLPSSLSQFV